MSAIAATRLTEAGLDIPRYYLAPEPELTLYARLQNEREDAYHYYNALLNRLNSFCNALELSYKYKPSNKALEPTSKRSSKVKDCLRRLNITVIDPNRSRVDMFSSWDITHRLKPLT